MTLAVDYEKIKDDAKKVSEKIIAEWLLNGDIEDKSIFDKDNKSLEECMKYIIDNASKQKNGNCAVIDDATVFGWAKKYYEDDSIVMDKPVQKAEVKTNATQTKIDVSKPKVQHKEYPHLETEASGVHYLGDSFTLVKNKDLEKFVKSSSSNSGVIMVVDNCAVAMGNGKATVTVYTAENSKYYRSAPVTLTFEVTSSEQLSLF